MTNFSKVSVDVIELFLVKFGHVFHLFICCVNCLIAPFFSCFLFVWIMAKIKACEFFLIGHVYASFRMLNSLFERRSEEHTSELQSRGHLVCRLLLEKKKNLRADTAD